MGRYDSHKFPLQYTLNQWSAKRINTSDERLPKSIPCHVTKVDKDFIYVAFETQNSIFTPPTVKIPKSNSQYAREPTQVGDKGYAVPGDYYLGGVTGDAGGNTDFYPRGNLTTISFNGISHKQNPQRDYDQLTHMGGPNGWIVGPFQKQQQDQQAQQQQTSQQGAMAVGFKTTTAFRNQQSKLMKQLGVNPTDVLPGIPPALGQIIGQIPGVGQALGLLGQLQGLAGGLGGLLGGGQQDKTQFSFDKNGKSIMQSKDDKHMVVTDQQNKTTYMKAEQTIYHDPGSGKVYLGGDGKTGTYALVATVKGPSINTLARIG
jgi:hypothetical protein